MAAMISSIILDYQMTKSGVSANIFEIKMTLKDIKPAIWRRVQVRSDITLADLHQVIQFAMGWTDSHLHKFVIDGRDYSAAGMIDDDFEDEIVEEESVHLDKLAAAGSRFVYLYDFGDGWAHDVKVERAIPWESEMKTPHCVAGTRACPPEDCGGTWGYADMLEKLAGSPCTERSELIEWLGDEFDPEYFDLQEVNELLKGLQG